MKITDFMTEDTKALKYAVMVAVVLGIATVVVIYAYTESESYSALYLQEYSNYVEDGKVSFVYGVERFGPTGASYDFAVHVDGVGLYSNTFDIASGTLQRRITFPVDVDEFPVKVQIVLKERGGETYYVHFWLKGIR
jgi:hypothetical protein